MCRLLGYLGSPLTLEKLLYQPEHSLIVQSYQPKEMKVAILNADGFGMGWYDSVKEAPPYTYKNTIPIWHDLNLPQLSRYVESPCMLGYVRSATPGLPVDFSNTQPFTDDNWLFFHNGFIENFRSTLYLKIRQALNDTSYQWIQGNTDSEHIFAMVLDEVAKNPQLSKELALGKVISQLAHWSEPLQVPLAINLLMSNGKQLIASRYGKHVSPPSLYWLKNDLNFPQGVIIASEPLFEGNWNRCPESSIISVGEDLEVNISDIPARVYS